MQMRYRACREPFAQLGRIERLHLLRGEARERRPAARRHNAQPHIFLVPLQRARLEARRDVVEPLCEILGHREPLADDRQARVAIAERVRQQARRLLTRLGVEELALPAVEHDAGLPAPVPAFGDAAFVVAALGWHARTSLSHQSLARGAGAAATKDIHPPHRAAVVAPFYVLWSCRAALPTHRDRADVPDVGMLGKAASGPRTMRAATSRGRSACVAALPPHSHTALRDVSSHPWSSGHAASAQVVRRRHIHAVVAERLRHLPRCCGVNALPREPSTRRREWATVARLTIRRLGEATPGGVDVKMRGDAAEEALVAWPASD